MDSEQRFFVLDEEYHGPYETRFSRADEATFGDAPRCPKCGKFIGLLEWLPPYRGEITVYGPTGAGDFMLGPGYDLVASQRFAEAFQKEGLTGLVGFHQIEIANVIRRSRRKALSIPRYLLVSVVFGRAAVDQARSRLRIPGVVTCDECRSIGLLDAVHGFSIQRGTWSGEDVFRPRGLQGRVVVTERFAQFVAHHALTNIKLTPTERFVWDPLDMGPPPRGSAAPPTT
jgi:hypothetical protein